MKLFYYCYGSAHSSVTAANIHLGHLPTQRPATFTEIIHQPLFDRAEDDAIGDAIPMGTDEWGHEVYVIGLAGGRQVMARALQDFLAISGVPPEAVAFEDALNHAGLAMRVGGYSSRRLGLIWLGRPLCALGVLMKYPRFVAHVQQVRARLAQS